MFKMSEYSFMAGLLSVALALLCYGLAFASVRVSRREQAMALEGGPAGASVVSGSSVEVTRGPSGLATYGTLISWLALAFISAALVFRTIAVGHGPFSNMYEFSVAFAWGVLAIYVYFERRYHQRALALIALPVALGLMLYATTIPSTYEPLVPALQNSLLLTTHVAVAIVAYGGFAVAFAAAALHLIASYGVRAGGAVGVVVGGVVGFALGGGFAPGGALGFALGGALGFALGGALGFALGGAVTGTRRLSRLELLDEISYRAVVVGFPFLTLVIILGAVWANVAWGRYWGWDPKETASLVTWLIYGAYLHARVVRGWRGNRAAVLLVVGFVATLFTYFGNLIFTGLHSYSGLN